MFLLSKAWNIREMTTGVGEESPWLFLVYLFSVMTELNTAVKILELSLLIKDFTGGIYNKIETSRH